MTPEIIAQAKANPEIDARLAANLIRMHFGDEVMGDGLAAAVERLLNGRQEIINKMDELMPEGKALGGETLRRRFDIDGIYRGAHSLSCCTF